MPSKGKNEMKIYKNLHVVAFVAAMMALGAQAVEVSPEQVQAAVAAWTSANGAAFASLGTAMEPSAVRDDDGRVLYWIVPMSNGGAVIASPDSDLDLVISVLEKYDGSFPAGHPLPSILKYDMRNRLEALAQYYAKSGSSGRPLLGASAGGAENDEALARSISAAKAQWEKYGVGSGRRPLLGAAELAGGDASPYVRRIVDGFEKNGRFTHWNQSGGIYNFYTPNNEVCGCVATAGAAILQFFNCTNDPGEVESPFGCRLYGTKYPCETQKGETDWSSLPAEYGGEAGGSLDDAGRQLLGRATYNLGVLVGMSWAEDGPGKESGSYVTNLVSAFKAYGFKTSRYVEYGDDESVDGNVFMKTIYAQLWCGAPVVLSIKGQPGGHAVVACGYARDLDGDEFCRVFMGWGGSGDAWYRLPAVQKFSVVNGAVTMIGYADDAVVPVYGSSTEPGIELSIPGYVTNEVPVKVPVDANGYFGIRVPISLAPTSRYLVDEASGSTHDITPFDVVAIARQTSRWMVLDAALPDEILFSVYSMDVRSTVASARAVALRDGKALLMISGTPSTTRTQQVLDGLKSLDGSTDLASRFVMVFTSTTSSDVNGVDGDPSIGVFDPAVGTAELRLCAENGRLAYTNFVEGADSATGELIYSLDSMTSAEVEELLSGLLETGYDAYLRGHSDAVVTVTGVDADSGSNEPFEVAAPVAPAYGEIAKAWTNCEAVVFSAPAVYTNFEAGVVYSCLGWSTNTVFSRAGKASYTAGNEVSITLVPGSEITFTWVWRASHSRVTALPLNWPLSPATNVVTPSVTWCAANDRVSISAEAGTGVFGLASWSVLRVIAGAEGGDYAAFYDGNNDPRAAMVDKNGTVISFFVYEPVEVKAKYRKNAPAAPDPTAYSVTVSAEPAEVAGFASLAGGLTWGENTVYDGVAHLASAASSYTDATGGVWVCTGWQVGGKDLGADVAVELSAGSTTVATSLWQLQSPEPDPPAPTPGPISISGIEQAANGSWTITVSGVVKGCWYWLYATDDLAAVSGAESAWTAGKAITTEANPLQATADGSVVFHATSSDVKCFWRAKATSTETGN